MSKNCVNLDYRVYINENSSPYMIEEYKSYIDLSMKLHNPFGPAKITHSYKNTLYSKEWYSGGKLHNISGPSTITYYEDGTEKCKTWHIYGKLLTEKEFGEYNELCKQYDIIRAKILELVETEEP